jgi:hypothetical protein
MVDILVGQIVGGPLMASRALPTTPKEREALANDVWDFAEALMDVKHVRRPSR